MTISDFSKNKVITLISVCIATFKRQLLLEQLLESLSKLLIPENTEIEIIIVDNDKDRSAENVVQKFKTLTNFQVSYFVQPIKNISITRNKALENAKGNLIAFIDDDETADEKWLYNLYNCLKNYNSDGVFGLVVPRFEEGINDKFKKREYFFSNMGVTGTEAKYMFAGSVLFKSELVKKNKIFFDPEYGITGGEDSDFFNRLKQHGARFINCREAISYEFISKERTTRKFFYNRFIRGGQTYARNFIKHKGEFFIGILIPKAFAKILIGTALLLPGFFHTKFGIKSLSLLGSGIGEIRGSLGFYKNIH
ncbi:glycosyltransferase [Ignavibacterium sp.]|uniref:glycosyltransferase family 2 protein n=1 Tax=Ignavibacterium sp. TaxID=2651167 RepID=UPI002206BA79|nr:glycosyltransferase [Ignavibacterium sp.]BDQ02771.1 MAG: glycosyl transferase family A [Ignavibacterium sp.]